MNDMIGVPVAAPTVARLLQFLADNDHHKSLDDVVGAALDAWLIAQQPAATCSPSPSPSPSASLQGYQWKLLFLPHGTRLRMLYDGDYVYAEVVGDHIMYRGMPLSPAALVNQIGGGVRNAWRELWLRRPGDHRWHRANAARQEIKFRKQANTPAEPRAPVWPSQPSTDVARDRLHQAQQFANAKLSWTMAQRGGYADTCPFID